MPLRTGIPATPRKTLALALLAGLVLALNPSAAHAGFVGPTAITINGTFTGWTARAAAQPSGLAGDPTGLGYTTAGFNNVHLSDGAYGNINTTPTPTTSGTYNPSGGSTAFQAYNGQNPNGSWVLFISDLNGGDTSSSRLNSWSLTFDAVPEPVNVALGIFGGVVLVVILARSRPVRNWLRRARAAFVHWVNAV
jgi:hypothetical protein